jgi:protein gp37
VLSKLDWLIHGGASSKHRSDAHPFDLEWAYDLKKQCAAAKIPYFLKQLGSTVLGIDGRLRDSHGGNWAEWPEDLRVWQMPIYVGAKDRSIRQRKVG